MCIEARGAQGVLQGHVTIPLSDESFGKHLSVEGHAAQHAHDVWAQGFCIHYGRLYQHYCVIHHLQCDLSVLSYSSTKRELLVHA